MLQAALWTTIILTPDQASTTPTFLKKVMVEMELWGLLCALTSEGAKTKPQALGTSIQILVSCLLELALTITRVTMLGKCVIPS